MLAVTFAGMSITGFEVTLAMWETNKSSVFFVYIVFVLFWINLLMDYLDEKSIEKINKIRYDI